jgi:predicted XRE-type DNA-binding protein
MTAMKKVTARPCGNCGVGTLRPASVRGTAMEHRDDPAVRIRAELALPVCDHCGDMALDREQTRALEDALEEAYVEKRRRMQRALINDLRRQGITQQQIERFASVSPGYVSKLRNGKIASGNTFRLLYLLHEMPREALRAIGRLDPRVVEKERPRRAARL